LCICFNNKLWRTSSDRSLLARLVSRDEILGRERQAGKREGSCSWNPGRGRWAVPGYKGPRPEVVHRRSAGAAPFPAHSIAPGVQGPPSSPAKAKAGRPPASWYWKARRGAQEGEEEGAGASAVGVVEPGGRDVVDFRSAWRRTSRP